MKERGKVHTAACIIKRTCRRAYDERTWIGGGLIGLVHVYVRLIACRLAVMYSSKTKQYSTALMYFRVKKHNEQGPMLSHTPTHTEQFLSRNYLSLLSNHNSCHFSHSEISHPLQSNHFHRDAQGPGSTTSIIPTCAPSSLSRVTAGFLL